MNCGTYAGREVFVPQAEHDHDHDHE